MSININNIHKTDWIKDNQTTRYLEVLNFLTNELENSWRKDPINCGKEFNMLIWIAVYPRNTDIAVK